MTWNKITEIYPKYGQECQIRFKLDGEPFPYTLFVSDKETFYRYTVVEFTFSEIYEWRLVPKEEE